MTSPLVFYMDEAGFTGQDLVRPDQPVYAHASTVIGWDDAHALYAEHFHGTQAPELKHSTLSKNRSGQRRIAAFISAVSTHYPEQFTIWVTYKEFCLLTYLIDLWIESAMYEDGYDLYQNGGNLALSNVMFYVLRMFEGPEYLRDRLTKFQVMMRERSLASFSTFARAIQRDCEAKDPRTGRLLTLISGALWRLGYSHLHQIPPRAINPAFPAAVFTCAHWRKRFGGPLALIHDNASELSKDRPFWDLITSPEIESYVYNMPGREMILPLNVVSTQFNDSKVHLQLQFADLLAGAMSTFGRYYIDGSADAEYVSRLRRAGIEDLLIGSIWPEPKVEPDELGTRGMSGEPVETLTSIIRRNDTD